MSEEKQYEIVMGKLILVIVGAMLVTLAIGYFLGNSVGKQTVDVTTPNYCSATWTKEGINVKCNELTGLDMGSMCKIMSSELKDKIKIVVIT